MNRPEVLNIPQMDGSNVIRYKKQHVIRWCDVDDVEEELKKIYGKIYEARMQQPLGLKSMISKIYLDEKCTAFEEGRDILVTFY